jgi:proteic killer suppression protein
MVYRADMIRSFRSRALTALWQSGDAARIRPDLVKRLKIRLARLDAAIKPEDMNAAGFNFHKLRGRPTHYTVHANGPWCLTFEWEGEDAVRVDLEQYH